MKPIIALVTLCITLFYAGSGNAISCAGAPVYSAGNAYTQGQSVQNKGSLYRCDIAGWCSSAGAWAYEPGVGSAWQQAWTALGACDSSNPSSISQHSSSRSAVSSVFSSNANSSVGTSGLPFVVSNTTRTFVSGTYNISGSATIRVDIEGKTPASMESTDYFRIYYRVNGGARVALSLNTDGFARRTNQVTVTANSIVIEADAKTDAADESYHLYSITVTSASSSSSSLANSSLTNSSSGVSSSSGNIGSIVPLFNGSNLEPNTVVDTGSAIVTRIGDRARDRHARDANFQKYDHYLPRYWEHRSSFIEIIDRVAKGGSTITINVTSLHLLAEPDFRAFFKSVPATYAYNQRMTRIDPLHYTATIDKNYLLERPLQVGEKMEIEFSPFLSAEAPLIGRTNYYGTALLYTVGTGGIVPWETQNASLDSFPVPANNRLGGLVTLPRNYSNEPMQAFKQTAGNMSHTNIQSFLLGRRLHHTDFGDGSHSEVGNPIMDNHVNQLGPRYVGRSCLGCHLNNGGGLPPGTTAAEFNVQFFVKNSPRADILYYINGVSQAFQMESAGSNLLTWIVRDIPGGATVSYRFTMDKPGGGQSVSPLYNFTMAGGNKVTQTSEGFEYGHLTLSPELQYVFRVGIDPSGAPHPNLGKILQSLTTSGSPEAGVSLSGWRITNGTYAAGGTYQLRQPEFQFSGIVPSYYSALISPSLVGLGLLEAIPESSIAALADPNDQNGDGISGRMSLVSDPETGQTRLGRYGWKATSARLSHQIGNALVNDMGVTNAIFPNPDCGSAQSGCGAAGNEVSRAEIDQWVKYIALLGIQARRNLDAQATTGQSLFTSAGCAKCHTPQQNTGSTHPYAELRNQAIWPYSDMLLHDMGAGLASAMGDGSATNSEWRTAPLWNISYRKDVSGGGAYLHDGRARNLSEAILWHGGEAESAKEAFRTMSSTNRDALLKFLQSL